MIPTIIIDPNLDSRVETINQILKENKLSQIHPNMLWIPRDEKLGIKEARVITQHLSLKPFQSGGQAVVLLDGDNLTPEAQNALLKTLEEPPERAIILIGVSSEDKLLPTVLSRCQVVRVQRSEVRVNSDAKYQKEITELIKSSVEQRFIFIEKLKDREDFFKALIYYYHQVFYQNQTSELIDFLKQLTRMEEYWQGNVNQRAILEYLMLILPSTDL